MAYDDDDGKRFRDFEDMAALFERFLSSPENLSIERVLALATTVHETAAGRAVQDVSITDLQKQLSERGLGSVQFSVVVNVLEAVSALQEGDEVLDKLSLRDLKRIVGQ